MGNRPTQQIASLTAAEAFVIMDGPGASPAQALKVALTELIALGQLRPKGTMETRFVPIRDGVDTLPPTLRALWECLAAQPKARVLGLPVSEIGKAVRAQWKSQANSYIGAVIMPELYRRGLYSDERYRRFRFFPAMRVALTQEGQEIRKEVERLKWLSEGGPRHWERDMVGGTAGFAAMAGVTIFLFNQDGNFFKELALAEQAKVGAGLGNFHVPDLEGVDTLANLASVDWGNIDITGSIDTFFDSFDSFDSFDAVFDGGGGDFGGDNGGSDVDLDSSSE